MQILSVAATVLKENCHLQAVNDIDSDDLDEEEEQKSPAKKRKLSKKEQEKLKAKEKAKAKRGKKKGGDDSDFEDDSDEDEYSALSRRAISNRDKGAVSAKPPVGSFETCAECEKQFTVVRTGFSQVTSSTIVCSLSVSDSLHCCCRSWPWMAMSCLC